MARSRSRCRTLAVLAAIAAALVLAPAAQAAIPSIPASHDGTGTIACPAQSAPNEGERHCSGIFTTFDGAPIDINVGFPPAPASGPDGDFPIIGVFHGWGGSKLSLTSASMQQWLDEGYAVFSMSDRGWGMSCGGMDPKRLQPVCRTGYNHLMDTRYEVRDAQELFEALADQAATGASSGEGLIDPQRIAPTGGSYGGAISMALGALKSRKMMPDGSLVPWASDDGKPMQIAAAQPDIPWTDLAYSLQPNGATLDYVADSPYFGPNGDKPIGVLKQSFVAGLYGVGQATSNYALPGTDPDADLVAWYARVNAGEPYADPLAADMVAELTAHHSSYYIDDSIPPAPMLISNGWTDDLFPADEAIRFYNRTRTIHPGTPISLMFTDHGHQRGQNKPVDADFRNAELHAWFDHYVMGTGAPPFQGVQTLTQKCPSNLPSRGATGPFDDAATDQPFKAPSWAAIAPGEVRLASAAAQTILPGSGNPQAGQAFDPIAGDGACATAPANDTPNVANYRLDPAPRGGFTLMGSPTIIADISAQSPTSQVAARLLDIDRDTSRATLVARGLYRPTGGKAQVFQLHPNGWRFEEGHVAKLELLPTDSPYGRASNGQGPVRISELKLRLPVLEQPDGGVISPPASKVVPEGFELAPGFAGGGGQGGSGHCANRIMGTNGKDNVHGTPGSDLLRGRGGPDKLSGGGGDDCLNGGRGKDKVRGGGGDDEIRARRGGKDKINCGGGDDVVFVNPEKDKAKQNCETVREGGG